jgi:hypothetical protein
MVVVGETNAVYKLDEEKEKEGSAICETKVMVKLCLPDLRGHVSVNLVYSSGNEL